MKCLYVYILECSDYSLYVGVTNNVGRRFIELSNGSNEATYTYRIRPVKLVFCKQFDKQIETINYVKQLKGWTHAKKVALINSDYFRLHELAACKNETSHKNISG